MRQPAARRVRNRATAPLLPRFQRPLTFGAILDETIQIFRKAWPSLAGAWAISILFGTVISATLIGLLVAFGVATSLNLNNPQALLNPSNPGTAAALAVAIGVLGLLIGLTFGVFVAAAIATVTVIVDDYVRGLFAPFWSTYLRGLAQVPVIIVAGIIFFLAILVITLLAIPTFILGVFGLLGGLMSLIGLTVWAANSNARRPWLKWLIILATPFGLVIYYSIRWSLWMQAIVLERAGPIRALQRSAELVAGNWFRAFGVAFVLGLIGGVLQQIPGALLGFVVLIVTGSANDPNASNWASIAQSAGALLGSLLFGALPFVGYTLLFIDLRNRREGMDLVERLAGLESSSLPGAGQPLTAS